MKRVSEEPAFLLHRYDWSETSLIVEVYTRHHGRVALVAKGAKRPASALRPILLPLQPLVLSYGGEGEIRTLRSAEWAGGHVMPVGDALLTDCYLNELVMRLLARDDPHETLFDAYGACVQVLAAGNAEAWQLALRAFELLLLRDIGLLPALDLQTGTLGPVQPGTPYVLVPEGGLREAHGDDRSSLDGAQWLALQLALDDAAPFAALVRVCAQGLHGLKTQLRTLLHYHCGVSVLRTRQMMIELQAL